METKCELYATLFGGTFATIQEYPGTPVSPMYSKAVEMLDKYIEEFDSKLLDPELVDWINSKALDDLKSDKGELACLPFWKICLGGHLELAKFYSDKFLTRGELNSVIYNLGFVFACQGGHIEIAKWLSEKCGDNALAGGMKNACEYGRYDVFIWLLEKCGDNGHYFFDDACRGRNVEIVKVLWERFSENFSLDSIDDCIDEGIASGNLEIVKFLLEKARINDITFCKFPIACQNGHLEMVEWLLQNHKDNIVLVDESFYHACVYGQVNIAKLIYSAFPRLDYNRFACFNHSKAHGHVEVTRWLAETFYKPL